MARLARNVHAADAWWGPDYGNADQVPEHVAVLITNPDAWDLEAGTPPSDGGRAQFLARLGRIGYPDVAVDAVGQVWDGATDEQRADVVTRSDAELSLAMQDLLKDLPDEPTADPEPAPDAAGGGEGDGSDPDPEPELVVPDGKVDDILAWVNEDPADWKMRAHAAIAAETAEDGQNRKGIIGPLTDALRDDD